MPQLVKTSHEGVLAQDPNQISKLPIYSVEIPGSRPADGSETGELRVDFPTIKTMYDAFQHGKKISGNRPCAGHRPTTKDPVTGVVKSEGFVWQTYNQISERRINFGCGLSKINKEIVKGEDKFNLGIYAVNRPEWLIADLAAQCFSLTTVALYDTLGPETAEFILNHSEVPVCVTSIDKVANLIKLAPQCPALKVVISMDLVAAGPATPFAILKQWAAEKGLTLLSFAEVEAIGEKNRVPLVLPKPEDPACISYTSGELGVLFCFVFFDEEEGVGLIFGRERVGFIFRP
ncbi:hypothetical protein HDU67_000257 [Dinochytrium kinnereticum]|nr:hypothetical protein HDU67_000257 [Dinochytrium kinnereticum]